MKTVKLTNIRLVGKIGTDYIKRRGKENVINLYFAETHFFKQFS